MAEDDQSWMMLSQKEDAWQTGFAKYIDDAFEGNRQTAPCPCCRCRGLTFKTKTQVQQDLLSRGFHKDVIMKEKRLRATEPRVLDDDGDIGDGGARDDVDSTNDLVKSLITGAIDGKITGTVNQEPNETAKKFFNLMQEARKELYPGCKEATKVSFIVRLFQIKCMFGISNQAMEQILHLFCLLLPEGHCIPDSLDKIRKVVRDLGLDYHKIHACVNDCVLFRGVYEHMDTCPTCGESRWKTKDPDGVGESTGDDVTKKKLFPRKILRYFPLIPRLQRLYMNEITSLNMRWHKDRLVCDGKMRHPADSQAWKHVDEQYKEFALDPRNVRLGLASDGFNPFGMLNVTYTTWPVILIPYNLPPWLCLKQSYWMMSMLVPGPKSPGMNIDVYLQPLIDELKELWEKGVESWDAKEKKNFTLRALLLWTINDFPAYAMLSGWSTKGKFAYPYCHIETDHLWLKYGSKHCYMGHRRFLPLDHRWRRNKSGFNNKYETRERPVSLSGEQVLLQYASFEQVTFGKDSKKRKQRDEDNRWHNWRKKSIFFQLPYWKSLLIRHNLDVMHVEKNVCESLIGTLLDLDGKSKDGEKARLDLQHLGIRTDLHPEVKDGKYNLPAAVYYLEKDKKQTMCRFLQQVKMPDGYASNIRRCVDVDGCKLTGVKSHDYHVILQKLFPLVIRHLLPKAAAIPLIQLSKFFNSICSKELEVTKLEELSNSIAETLCSLEMIFPPALFDIMLHLPVHIAEEARLGGPVCYRWMYPVERYLRTLKGYVRNKAAPEGSIAEGYISEECLTFCSRFFDDISTKENRPDRHARSVVSEPPSGLSVFGNMDYERAHRLESVSASVLHRMRHYILTNCEEASSFVNQHMDELKKISPRKVAARHKEQFVSWFEREISKLHATGEADDMLHTLSRGPDQRVRVSNRCHINGFLFRTASIEKSLTTQNSGVVVQGDDREYYGVIERIITLNFKGSTKEVILFECTWFDVPGADRNKSRGFVRDEYGIIDIDTTLSRYSDEPYILATQAEQVCYLRSAKRANWCSVLRLKPRNLFAMPEGEVTGSLGDRDVDSLEVGVEHMTAQNSQDLTNWRATGVEGVSGDVSVIDRARASAMPEPHDADIPEEDLDADDTYIDDGVVAPAVNTAGEDDTDFFV